MTEASLGRIGKYDLRAEIGRGGFGVVYRATDASLGREVALKVLHPQLIVDPEFIARFRLEAQTASRLDHPNIITIYEYGEVDGRFLIAMRYVPGQSLKQLLTAVGPLPLERIVRILGQVAEALDHAHARGLIHRDVKSANILVEADDRVTLTDFGLVRAAEGGSVLTSLKSGAMIGTPEYMAPEQLDVDFKGTIDARADIYSLGIVAFEMLTGRVPYQGNTPAVVAAHLIKAAPDLRGMRPDLPDGMGRAILTALAKRPVDRQADVAAFARELRQGLAAEQRRHAKQAEGSRQKSGAASTSGTDWRPARLGGQWLTVGLAAAGFVGVGVVAVLALLLSNLNAGRSLTATKTAAILSFATASAPAATKVSPIPAVPTTSPTSVAPSATPTALPPTCTELSPSSTAVLPTPTIPSPTPALNIGSTQVSPADGMVLLYVPAGSFLMGSADSDTQAYSREKPQHTVDLDAFWIDQTDVTNAKYAKCVKAGACQAPSDTSSGSRSSYYGNTQFADFPVVYVSWNDANTYCGWAGRRLPTEAEWEKAARGTDGRLYPWGNAAPNYTLLNYNQKPGDTTAVGSYPTGASPYGALDMAGNVFQWVADRYADDYYAQSPASNPMGPSSGQGRVVRGWYWFGGAQFVRAAYRGGSDPANGGDNGGFRCARS